ncbi:MAG: ABC transporter permease [Bacteroidota bacterium]
MSPFALTLAHLRRRPWGTALNIVLLALGVGSIVALLLVGSQLDQALARDAEGIDVVVGAKGSPLQLVLSSVYHADVPTGNVKEAEAEAVLNNPSIESWVPLALGDSYRGRRVVGTTTDFPALYDATTASGRLWEDVGEATLGASVARDEGIAIGDDLVTTHGLTAGGEAHGDDPLRVVGVLAPTGTVIDRLVLTSVETVRAIHGEHDHEDGEHSHEDDDHDEEYSHDEEHGDDHDHDGGDDHGDDHGDGDHEHGDDLSDGDHEHDDSTEDLAAPITEAGGLEPGPPGLADGPPGFGLPGAPSPNAAPPEDDGLEITAALARFASPLAVVSFPRFVNSETNLQAASPALEAQRLLGLLGVGLGAIRAFGLVLAIGALLGVAVGLYNAMRERRVDLAVMRTLGATRKRLVAQVLLEGVLLTTAGTALGVALGHGAVAMIAAASASTRSPLPVTAWTVTPAEIVVVVLAIAVGALVALIPAIQVYRADVARTLAES